MPEAEFRRGQGPNALPQGAATALNEAQPDLDDDPAAGLLPDDDIPVQFTSGKGAPIPDDDSGLSDDLKILLGPPNPNYRPRLARTERPGRVPTYVVRQLPQLIAAAADPAAPPTLIALKNSILRYIEDEMRRGG